MDAIRARKLGALHRALASIAAAHANGYGDDVDEKPARLVAQEILEQGGGCETVDDLTAGIETVRRHLLAG